MRWVGDILSAIGAIALVVVLAVMMFTCQTRDVGKTVVYRATGSRAVVVAVVQHTMPRCYVIRLPDGSTLTVPCSDLDIP